MGVAAAGVAIETRRRVDVASALVFAGSACAVGGLLAANGGYFPAAASWASLAVFWAAGLALLLRSVARPSRLELVFGAALVALAAWTWASLAWSSDVTQSVWEGERTLVLLGGVAAVVALAPRRPMRPLLAGVLLGAFSVCAYSLATRLFPARLGSFDSVTSYRLNAPVGYWNGLGITAALAIVLALGFAARARRALGAATAAASLLIFVPTLYFTYSRGAWLALAVALVVALVVDPRRLGLSLALAVLGVAPAAAVLVASRSRALTHEHATLASAQHDGRRIAVLLVLLAVVEAALAWTLAMASARIRPRRTLRRAWAAALALLVGAVVATAVVRYGSPAEIAARSYRAFTAPPVSTGTDLNARLFHLNGSGRIDLWRAALEEWRAHPVLGGGAGTYARWWAAHRRGTQNVQDAHNLYLETLAELGPVGLAALAAVLLLPFVAAWRARRRPLVPFAAAAFAAFAVHAAIDWDWELAGVALAAFLCGFACLASGRRRDEPVLVPRVRYGAVAVAALLAFVSFAGVVGNTALERSDAAAGGRAWRAAASDARTAIRWLPWSAAGWQRLAEAQLAEGDSAGARRSLTHALAKDRGDWVVWLDYANATSGAARAHALEEVVRLNPRDPNLAELLASVVGP
jgi:hypothetical protein